MPEGGKARAPRRPKTSAVTDVVTTSAVGGDRPSPAGRELAAQYCAANGDLALAAERAKVEIDTARAMVASSWWSSECAGYWAEHPPSATQAALAVRDVLVAHARGQVSDQAGLAAARIALDTHTAETQRSQLADIVGAARRGQSDTLMREIIRRNVLRLPPAQHRVVEAFATDLLDAYPPPSNLDELRAAGLAKQVAEERA